MLVNSFAKAQENPNRTTIILPSSRPTTTTFNFKQQGKMNDNQQQQQLGDHDGEDEAYRKRYYLKNNTFNKTEREAFTRALKVLLTPDVVSVAASRGVTMGHRMHIPHLMFISTISLRGNPEGRIDEKTIALLLQDLVSRVKARRVDYEALLGERTSDFSKLATLRLCYNYKANGNKWQMMDISVNEDLLQREA